MSPEMFKTANLNSWIIDSGIIIQSKIPENYQYLITPIPYMSYSKNITIGQGIAFRHEEPGPVRHLKITIDFEFEQSNTESSIVISRGKPIVQWILIDTPIVNLVEANTDLSLIVNF